MRVSYATLFVFTIGILLSITGCQKVKFKEGEKRLPLATEKGRGIFACYIDGNTYITRRKSKVTYNYETGYLYVLNENDQFKFRLFVYEGLQSEGVYEFSNTGEEWISSDFISYYGVDPDGISYLDITKLDFNEDIIAGLFHIDLINEEGEIKTIRDGRFDLQMEYID